MSLPEVVIIGGGFGGLAAAKALRRAPVRVTVLDRENHHVFQPLLYQVATAALSPADVAYPIRAALRHQANARVLLADVQSVDVDGRRITVDGGALDYDFAVIACGATHSYFGRDDWAKSAPGLKTVYDAIDIRTRVLFAYEAAEREADASRREAWLTFVVVGAGPTGVELAGALAEIGRHAIAHDFRRIDPTAVRVVLVEGAERALPTYPPELSERAAQQLSRLGVELRCATRVTDIDDHGVVTSGERIEARTVLWAAGVSASPVAKSLGARLDRAGRVLVAPDLTLPEHAEVFVIGDLAAIECAGKIVPGVAPAAVQGGRHAARNIMAAMAGRPMAPFRYRDKGSLATIGRSAAVADFGRLRFSGWFAWLLWWLVHILFLIGFRNRVIVLFGWAWQYVTFQRGARLITGQHGDLPRLGDAD